MIDVLAALEIIRQNTPKPRVEALCLDTLTGHILAENIRASYPLPIADNSAMDGFVLNAGDTKKATPDNPVRLKISGVIKAGDKKRSRLLRSNAFRIMTGAFIPLGANTVLPKELAVLEENHLIFTAPVAKGNHIRLKGEEIKKGALALPKGLPINPGTLGFLATLGKNTARVFARPRVSIIATGNELVEPGKPLLHGQIYESNSWMLRSALQDIGHKSVSIKKIKDNPSLLRRGIASALESSDILLLSGGVSVGDYDYVKEILAECGVRTLFWRVKQKPGKPLYFGRKGKTLVFGLPGNPASVFTCFYIYVYPALLQYCGFDSKGLTQISLPLASSLKGDPKRTHFLKARVLEQDSKTQALVLGSQGSHMLSSLTHAQGFVMLPPSQKNWQVGDMVPFLFLPHQRDRT